MDRNQKLQMMDAMSRYGGSFVHALAEAFRHADEDNTAALVAAFPEYVKRYQEMASLLRRDK